MIKFTLLTAPDRAWVIDDRRFEQVIDTCLTYGEFGSGICFTSVEGFHVYLPEGLLRTTGFAYKECEMVDGQYVYCDPKVSEQPKP